MHALFTYVRCVYGNSYTRQTALMGIVGLALLISGLLHQRPLLGVLGMFIAFLGIAGFWAVGMAIATYRSYVRTTLHYKKHGYIRALFARGVGRGGYCHVRGLELAMKDLGLRRRHIIEIPAKEF
jgi:vacuolar-type H+-ATPase subunit I/STV1